MFRLVWPSILLSKQDLICFWCNNSSNYTQMSNSITVFKLEHRGHIRIGLCFNYNSEIIERIRTIPYVILFNSSIKKINRFIYAPFQLLNSIRYSGTRKVWYLSYTKQAYTALKALNIPLIIEETTGTTESIDSKCVFAGKESKDSPSVVSKSIP